VSAPASTHPVAELIRARAASGSRPGARDDPHRVALVIEGGGMRGVVTSGMTHALEKLGYRDAFDEVHGVSAGTLTAAYFVARQAAYGETVFYDFLVSRRFVDFRRLLLRGSPMSLDYLLHEVIETERPLEYDAVLRSDIALHLYATNLRLEQREPVALPAAATKDELRRNFRASALIPVVAGPPTAIGDGLYCDAGIWDSIPWRFAERAGATHLLVLQSRPRNNPRRNPTAFERRFARRYFGRVAPAALEGYLTRVERYNEDCRLLARLSLDTERTPSLLAIAPHADAPHVEAYERSRRLVVDGARSGFDAVVRAFGDA